MAGAFGIVMAVVLGMGVLFFALGLGLLNPRIRKPIVGTLGHL